MYIFFDFILTPFDVCFCVDFILFLANSISTQYFPQFDTFCIIGITQTSVIWFGLQTKLTDWPLCGMQNVDGIKSDRTSNETDTEIFFSKL